jgi:hypothetical protein
MRMKVMREQRRPVTAENRLTALYQRFTSALPALYQRFTSANEILQMLHAHVAEMYVRKQLRR